MKRIILIAAALCIMLTGCAEKKKTGENESPVLNVGIINGNDRYSYTDGAEIKGIEADIARETATAMEKELNMTSAGSVEELYSGLKDGSFDLIFGRISETENALKNLVLSDNYGKSGIYFITKKYDYTDSLALRGSGMIGIMSSVKPVSDQVPGIGGFSVSDYSNPEELARDVANGTVTVGLCSEREALSVISDTIQVQEVLQGPYEYYVAAMKDDKKLKTAVNLAISAYYDSLSSKTGELAQGKETNEAVENNDSVLSETDGGNGNGAEK